MGDGESACRRGSVHGSVTGVPIGDHPSVRPTWRLPPGRDGRAALASCSALLRVGFAEPPGSLRVLVRSYRTVSPLPVPVSRPSAVCSLWHFPAGRPDWHLASTLPSGAPTFLNSTQLKADPSRDHPADSPSRTVLPSRRQNENVTGPRRPRAASDEGVGADGVLGAEEGSRRNARVQDTGEDRRVPSLDAADRHDRLAQLR